MTVAEKRSCKVLMIVAPGRFRDEEYDRPRKILERQGHEVKVACSVTRDVYGQNGMRVRPDMTLDQVQVSDFDAVVFVGGLGAKEYWDLPLAHQIAAQTLEQGKILGAICIAPVILARAGLLAGKKATVFYTEQKQITAAGAEYTAAAVTVDGNLITGKGPEAADAFGVALGKALLAVPAGN